MTQVVPTREHFEKAYRGQAPWDVPRPQPVFVQATADVTGRVLDSGCGTGENSLYFASRGHQVTGIDFLEEPITRARRKATERGLPVEFLVKDALTLADWDQRFDTVLDSGLFHVFDDASRARYVTGLSHVLRAGGRLLLLCFSDAEPGDFGPRRVKQPELRQAFSTGWHIESIAPVQFDIVELPDIHFSPGGPHAWFAKIRRA
jgi:cyclopropane fatty-acyl-phospholipid synthase-like methyltransferase